MNTVKYQANIETPEEYTGYLTDGTKNVPMSGGNRDYREVQEWIAEGNTPEPAYTTTEVETGAYNKAFTDSTNLITTTIQAEIDAYNTAKGLAFGSVHNAESYSRSVGYTHKNFCIAVWEWNVELWEYMRAWQSTLTTLPSETEVVAKIAEKPFTFTY